MSITDSTIADRTLTKLPRITAVLAMSADGKLADHTRAAGRFGSPQDQQHLEEQVAAADLVLFGAGTLRAYGTTMTVHSPSLQAMRQQAGKPIQPIQMVCSASGELDADCHFFSQPIPRWLLTTSMGAETWQERHFERVWAIDTPFNWPDVMAQLSRSGIENVALLGGGKIVASFFEAGLIDQLWLTVCPIILGGETSPTPVQKLGWLEAVAPRLKLLSAQSIGDEVFLHYQCK